MFVIKFGGTSLRDAARLAAAASIVARHSARQPVVVVSAIGNVTRRLLAAGKAAAAGDGGAADDEIDRIASLHHEILDGLAGPVDRERGTADIFADARATLGKYQADIRGVVETIRAGAAYPTHAQDEVISFGERLSTTLFAAAARAAGVDARRVDAASVIVTDDRFRNARPDHATIDRRAGAHIAPHVEAGAVVVTEGFIGATPDGVPTTMGFEASDLTASLLGAALGAEEIQIRTDVAGMLTTGHPAVDEPGVVRRLTFDEAAELALFGAKVLHPDSIAPARQREIPVRVLHATDLSVDGTWITAAGGEPTRPKAIAVTEDLDSEGGRRLLDELGVEAPAEAWSGQGVVCMVGQGIGDQDSIRAEIGRLLAGMPASRLSIRRPHAIPILVPVADVSEAVARLHAELID